MTIKSMTGFARADGASGNLTWHWEVRSVNGRGFDIRLRVPPGFEGLEPRIREILGKHVVRGSVTVNLGVRRTHGQAQIQLNETALRQVVEALEQLRQTVPVGPPSAEALLGIKGVLELVEPEENDAEALARAEAMLASLSEAVQGMVQGTHRGGQPSASRRAGPVDDDRASGGGHRAIAGAGSRCHQAAAQGAGGAFDGNGGDAR